MLRLVRSLGRTVHCNYVVSSPLCSSVRTFTQTSGLMQFGEIRKKNSAKKKPWRNKEDMQREKEKRKELSLKKVSVRDRMTVYELADVLEQDPDKVLEICKQVAENPQQLRKRMNYDLIRSVVKKFGFIPHLKTRGIEAKEEVASYLRPRPPPDESVLKPRPPVVTIMGHVDHGKTTLLDSLRSSRIVDKEFGGITQHIGAFSVQLGRGQSITFLDTPGHAAFSAMRARGAHVTDIVILVVAADDGVMRQTEESIKYAREAGVPIIVAVNKIDKPNADVQRAKEMLLRQGLQPEDMGGDTQCVPISALKGTNLDLLKETVITEAEMLNLKGDPTGKAEAIVIESRTDPGKGRVATALIKRGTLKKGACLVAGQAWAKVKGMRDDRGRVVPEARPSMAVEITGWKELPSAGDPILEAESEKHAQDVIKLVETMKSEEKAKEDLVVYKEQLKEHHESYVKIRTQIRDSFFKKTGKIARKRPALKAYHLIGGKPREEVRNYEGPELCIVVKGDVDGSVDALLDILGSYPGQQCRLEILSFGVGPITEADVTTAEPFEGIIYGFNVPVDEKAKQKLKETNIQIREYKVIYELIDNLKEELTKQLPPLQEDRVLGTASVLQHFDITIRKKKVSVAGCKCDSGHLEKNKLFRVLRDGTEVFKGGCESMRHVKNEVESIKTDSECGLMFRPEFVTEPGDIIECYEHTLKKQTLDWQLDF